MTDKEMFVQGIRHLINRLDECLEQDEYLLTEEEEEQINFWATWFDGYETGKRVGNRQK